MTVYSSPIAITMTPLACTLIAIHFFVVGTWLFSGSFYYLTEFYGPLKYQFKGKPFIDEYLEKCSPTTELFDDLVVDESLSPTEAGDQTWKHGAAIVQEILTPNTTQNLREYILKANHEMGSVYVKNHENRFHIMPPHTEPTIQAALQEIATHPVFRPLLDSVLGPSSSFVGMSVITNLYGAAKQSFHPDTNIGYSTHPDEFVPEFILAVPLQDTTREMGATQLCPGTHKCSDIILDDEEMYRKFMSEEYPADEEYDILLDDPEYNEWLTHNFPCKLVANVTGGSGLLYNTNTYHRGGAHVDPDAPERVNIFFIFAGSRKDSNDERSLPFGNVHSLYWKAWGHTIDDMANMAEHPWRLWHIFGLFSPSNKDGVKVWTVQDCFWMIFRSSGEAFYMISNEFDLAYLQWMLECTLLFTVVITGCYLFLCPVAWFIALVKTEEKPSGKSKVE